VAGGILRAPDAAQRHSAFTARLRRAMALRGAVRCRAGASVAKELTGVPVSAKRHDECRIAPGTRDRRFKFQTAKPLHSRGAMRQGLPVPREPREAMERWEAPGHQWAPLRQDQPTHLARQGTARAQG